MTDLAIGFLDMLRSWVGNLPDLSVDSSVVSSMVSAADTVVSFIAAANYIVPVPVILLILSIVYGFKVLKFSVFIINWVIRRIADFVP